MDWKAWVLGGYISFSPLLNKRVERLVSYSLHQTPHVCICWHLTFSPPPQRKTLAPPHTHTHYNSSRVGYSIRVLKTVLTKCKGEEETGFSGQWKTGWLLPVFTFLWWDIGKGRLSQRTNSHSSSIIHNHQPYSCTESCKNCSWCLKDTYPCSWRKWRVAAVESVAWLALECPFSVPDCQKSLYWCDPSTFE